MLFMCFSELRRLICDMGLLEIEMVTFGKVMSERLQKKMK